MESTLEIGEDAGRPELAIVKRNDMLVGPIPLGSPDMPVWAAHRSQNVVSRGSRWVIRSTLIQLVSNRRGSSKVASAVRQRVEAHRNAQGDAQPAPAEDDTTVAHTLLTMQQGDAGNRKRKLPEPDTLAENLVSMPCFVCADLQQCDKSRCTDPLLLQRRIVSASQEVTMKDC